MGGDNIFIIKNIMSKRLIITEEEKRNILSLYEQKDDGDFIVNIYNKIKGNPTMKKIDSLYDSNLITFISKVIKNFPNIVGGKEKEFRDKVNGFMKNPLSIIKQYQKQIESYSASKLNEQSFIAIELGILAVMLIIVYIVHVRYEKKVKEEEALRYKNMPSPTPTPEKSEIDKQLEVLNGKTLNIYNDVEEQILFGKDNIQNLHFEDKSNVGGRSSVKFGFTVKDPQLQKVLLPFGVYEIPCLSNPDRLAGFIVKEGEYTKDLKYNKKFTDAVSNIVSPFCKKPDADFGSIDNKDNTTMG
jgi:hypothetical protein